MAKILLIDLQQLHSSLERKIRLGLEAFFFFNVKRACDANKLERFLGTRGSFWSRRSRSAT